MTTITTRVNKTTELSYVQGDDNVAQDVGTKSGAYEADLDDNRTTYECTGTWDFTLPVADDMIYDGVNSSMADDYEVTVTNVGTGNITAVTQGADTLGGVAAPGDFVIPAGGSYTFKVNAGKDGYIVPSSLSLVYGGIVHSTNPAGLSTLPAGWSAANSGVGIYTVTHNLGITSYGAVTSPGQLIAPIYVSGVSSHDANSFTVRIFRTDTEAAANVGFDFVLVVTA